MSNLKTQIQACKQCPLFCNMKVSPVAHEIIGEKVDILIVTYNTVKKSNDEAQEVLSTINKTLLTQILTDLGIGAAITFGVKCQPSGLAYRKADFLACDWVQKEVVALQPKKVIAAGLPRYTNVKFDLKTPMLNRLLSSTQLTKTFTLQLKGLFID